MKGWSIDGRWTKYIETMKNNVPFQKSEQYENDQGARMRGDLIWMKRCKGVELQRKENAINS